MMVSLSHWGMFEVRKPASINHTLVEFNRQIWRERSIGIALVAGSPAPVYQRLSFGKLD